MIKSNSFLKYQDAITGVNLLLSDYFDVSDAAILRNRLQACRTFPMFTPIFCNAIHILDDSAFNAQITREVTDKDLTKLRQAIDVGQPLIKAMTICFKVKPNTIRYLVGKVQSQYCQKEFLHRVASFMKVIDSIAPDHRPKNEQDWEWFESFLDTSDSILTFNYQINWIKKISTFGYQKSQDKLIKYCKKDHPVSLIIAFIESLNFTVSRHAWRLIKNSSSAILYETHLNKKVKKISKDLVSFKSQLETRVHKVIEDHFLKMNIFELVKLATAWKEQLDKIQLATQPSRKLTLIKWRSLLDSPTSINGCLVVPLRSALDLHLEGEILQHCSATYVTKCLMDCDVHLFSIRDTKNKPLSTIEVNSSNQSQTIRLIQHVSFENSPPSPQCSETAKLFMTHLNNTVTTKKLKLIINEWLERSPANSLSVYRDLDSSNSIDVLLLICRQYFGKHVFEGSIGRIELVRLITLASKLN